MSGGAVVEVVIAVVVQCVVIAVVVHVYTLGVQLVTVGPGASK